MSQRKAPQTTVPLLLTPAQRQNLHIAGDLIAIGVPVLSFRPALDEEGVWNPRGGHRNSGYLFRREWQKSRPDPAELDPSHLRWGFRAWTPGRALVAVMGHRVDCLDVDPRNGGWDSYQRLRNEGLWPKAYARVRTPSGGFHDYIAPLGVGSRDSLLAGVDLKGGRQEATGRGFAFLPNTRKLSKATAMLGEYEWENVPQWLSLDTQGDCSGEYVARLVRDRRTKPNARSAIRSPKAKPAESNSPEAVADALPAAPLPSIISEQGYVCSAIRTQIRQIVDAPEGWRHEALLGPLLKLLRLDASGHRGLDALLPQIKMDFVAAVSGRCRGAEEAEEEFDRALDGARLQVPETPRGGRVCDCWIIDYEAVLSRTQGFSVGRAGLLERQVLREMLSIAVSTRSSRIRVDQGRLGSQVVISQPRVSVVQSRLCELGFLARVQAPGAGRATTWELRLPVGLLLASPPPARPPSAGSSTHTDVRPPGVPPLFQSHGLGLGPAETYRALPVLGRLLPRSGLIAVPVRLTGRPVSAKGIAKEKGKTTSTISRHLDALKGARCVLRTASGSGWWRLEVDLDLVATDYSLADRRGELTRQNDRQRLFYYAAAAIWEGERGTAPNRIVLVDTGVLIVDIATGLILATTEERWIIRDLWDRGQERLSEDHLPITRAAAPGRKT